MDLFSVLFRLHPVEDHRHSKQHCPLFRGGHFWALAGAHLEHWGTLIGSGFSQNLPRERFGDRADGALSHADDVLDLVIATAVLVHLLGEGELNRRLALPLESWHELHERLGQLA